MFTSPHIFESIPLHNTFQLTCSEPYIFGEYVLGSVLMAFGLSLGVYGGFVMDCIFTMCDYLDINCLTVKRRALDREIDNIKKK